MSKILYLATAVVLAWLASAPASVWAAGGYIFDASGSVSVAVEKNAPRPAVKYEAVTPGTVVRTGDNSHSVLKFEDGEVVSMQANSTFKVREYRYEPKQAEQSSIVFSMFKGGMRFVTGEIGQRNPKAYRLATPDATVRIRGTDFLVVMADNVTYSQVLSGSISVTNAAGMTVINAGQKGLTSSPTALTTLLPDSSVPPGIFSEIAAIPVPAAAPGPVPAPVPAPAAAAAPAVASTDTTAATTTAATTTAATTTPAAGGAAAGGAAASTAAVAGVASTGISATTIGIGIGVAAILAASVNHTTTTHH